MNYQKFIFALIVGFLFIGSFDINAQTVSNKFIIGDSVQTTATLRARFTPNGTILGSQTLGSTGIIIAGPIRAGGITWWKIDYTKSPDGWSAEYYLFKATPSNTDTISTASVDLKANGIDSGLTIAYNQSATLTWKYQGTVSGCNLGKVGGLFFPVNNTTSQSTGALTQTTTFKIDCNGGSVSDSVTLTVPDTAVPVPPSPSLAKFQPGDTVQTTSNANVRGSAGLGSSIIGLQQLGVIGTIASDMTNGPVSSSGYLWWRVVFNSGPSGWVAENYLTQALPVPPTPLPPLPIVSLSAPSVVISGQSFVLSWSSTNAVSCTASGGWSGAKATGGSQSITAPTVTGSYPSPISYILDCKNSVGGTNFSKADVTVNPVATAPAPTVTLSALPTAITAGEKSTLSWVTTNTTSCTASNAWTGMKPTPGTQDVYPTSSTTYTLSCTGPGGSASKSVTVTVNPSPITASVDLKANGIDSGLTIAYNQAATLTWTYQGNVSECNLGKVGGLFFPVNNTTSQSTGALTQTTTFKIDCNGGSVSDSVTLTVPDTAVPVPTLTFTASPTTITIGQFFATLTWSSTNTTSCTASNAWSGTKTTSGTQVITPTTTSTYTLDCTGVGGTTSKSVTVTVASPRFTIDSPIKTTASNNVVRSTPNGTILGTQALGSTGSVVGGPVSAGGVTWWNISYTNAPSGWSDEAYIGPSPFVYLGSSQFSISPGQPVTISWAYANVTSCIASGGWTGEKVGIGVFAQDFFPTTTTTYALSCTGPLGNTSKSVTVTVTSTPAPTITFSASPTTVYAGQFTTLTWSSTDATSCTASGDWTGAKATSGTYSAPGPTTTTPTTLTYTLSCTGSGGTASRSVNVAVIPLPTFSFTGSPTSITEGGKATLTWATTNTTSCTALDAWTGIKTTSGTEDVYPTSSTTYTLSCTGPGGTAWGGVTIMVTPAPSTSSVDIRANGSNGPLTLSAGQNLIISWTSASNIYHCFLDAPVNSGVYTNGSMTLYSGHPFYPKSSGTTYVISCTDQPGGAYTFADKVLVYAPSGKSLSLSSASLLAASLSAFTKEPVITPIFSSATPVATVNASLPNNLFRGSSGNDVITLQTILTKLGFYSDAATGFYGPKTETAVQSFQRAYGIVSSGTPAETGYGVAGPRTRAKIIELSQ